MCLSPQLKWWQWLCLIYLSAPNTLHRAGPSGTPAVNRALSQGQRHPALGWYLVLWETIPCWVSTYALCLLD